ncbi:MAG: hypothetical protein WBE88_14810 [Candidatus Acidiferrales bacterium]
MPALKIPRLLIGLTLVLGCAFGLSAQTRDLSVEVKDLSGPNSPITAKGQVLFQRISSADGVKTRHDIAVQLTNVSSKTIVAYEVSLQAMPDYGGGFNSTNLVDRFFRPQLQLGPGSQESWTFTDPGWDSEPSEAIPSKEPQASFTVLFVEFADGSKFGASPWASSLSDARQRAIERMQEIETAYETSGDDGLRTSLATEIARRDDPQMTTAVLNHLKATLDSSGPDAAAKQISDFLAAAQNRKEIM